MEENKKRKVLIFGLSDREILFLFAVILKMLAQAITISVIPFMIGTNISNYIFKVMTYSSYLLVILSFFIDLKISLKELLKIVFLVMLTAVGSYFTGNELLLAFIYVYGLKKINIDKIFKRAGIIYIGVFAFIVLGSLIGIIENWDFFAESNRPRWGLGYTYPTHTSSVLFMAVLVFCYIVKEKLNIWHVLCIEIINLWMFRYTDSRAGMILSAIAPVIMLLIKHMKRKTSESKIEWLLQWAFPVCAFTIIFLSLSYNGLGITEKLNSLLSDRLKLGGSAIHKYGIHLLGQRIAWIGQGGMGHTQTVLAGEYNYVDTSYIKMLLENGVIIWGVIMIGWTNTCIKAYKNNNRYLLWALAFLAVYCMIEQWLMNLGANLFLLYLAYNIYNPRKSKSELFLSQLGLADK